MSRGDGSLYRQSNSANYWMQFFLHGRKHRESTGASDEKKARDVLRKRLKEVHASEVTGLVFESVRMRKVIVSDLCDALESDLTLRGKWSAQNRSHLKRVKNDFGDLLAAAVTPEQIDKYIERRLASKRGTKGELIPGDRPASINRSLQLLGQCFSLAVKRSKLSRAPYIANSPKRTTCVRDFSAKRRSETCSRICRMMDCAILWSGPPARVSEKVRLLHSRGTWSTATNSGCLVRSARIGDLE